MTPVRTRNLPTLCAGLVVSGMLVGPAASDNHAVIKLKVPIQLKKMIAAQAGVDCVIKDAANIAISNEYVAPYFIVLDLASGEFDQGVEVTKTLYNTKTLADAKSYRCYFVVRETATAMNVAGWEPPIKASPGQKAGPGQPAQFPLWRLARPAEFFRWEVEGPLTGVAIGGAPKALQQGPKN